MTTPTNSTSTSPASRTIDEAAIEPARAYTFYAPIGSPAPTKADIDAFDTSRWHILSGRAPMSVWRTGGHTDLEEDFEADQEGGDSEYRGSRQNPNLRERIENAVEYLGLNLIEARDQTAHLYYGGGSVHAPGEWDAPDTPTAQDYATTIIYVDAQDRRAAEYHPRTSIRGNGAIGRAADGFLRFPIRFTWMKLAGQPVTRWIGDHFGGEADED